jgi:hypothetical protein
VQRQWRRAAKERAGAALTVSRHASAATSHSFIVPSAESESSRPGRPAALASSTMSVAWPASGRGAVSLRQGEALRCCCAVCDGWRLAGAGLRARPRRPGHGRGQGAALLGWGVGGACGAPGRRACSGAWAQQQGGGRGEGDLMYRLAPGLAQHARRLRRKEGGGGAPTWQQRDHLRAGDADDGDPAVLTRDSLGAGGTHGAMGYGTAPWGGTSTAAALRAQSSAAGNQALQRSGPAAAAEAAAAWGGTAAPARTRKASPAGCSASCPCSQQQAPSSCGGGRRRGAQLVSSPARRGGAVRPGNAAARASTPAGWRSPALWQPCDAAAALVPAARKAPCSAAAAHPSLRVLRRHVLKVHHQRRVVAHVQVVVHGGLRRQRQRRQPHGI